MPEPMKKTNASKMVQEWHEKFYETCVELPLQQRGCATCPFAQEIIIPVSVPSGAWGDTDDDVATSIPICEMFERTFKE